MTTYLEKVSFTILAALTFLLPIFTIPGIGVNLDIEKRFVLAWAVGAMLIIWVVNRLLDRAIIVPKNWLWVSLGGVTVISLISALLSSDISRSWFGFGYERDTVFSLIVLWLLMMLAAWYVNNKERLLLIFMGTVISGGLVACYQIIQTLLINVIGFKFLPGGTFNLIGRWGELGFFWGLMVVISLMLLELIPWRKPKLFLWLIRVSGVLALIGLILNNSWLVWLLVGLVAVILFVYQLVSKTGEEKTLKKSLPWLSLALVVLSILFIVFARPNSPANILISNVNARLNLNTLEVNPSFEGTWALFIKDFKTNPVLGVGPNAFNLAWSKYKPAGVNETPFWNVDFNNGSSFITTFLVTAGILGGLVWLIFLFFLGRYSWKFNRQTKDEKPVQILFTALSLVVVYLWLVALVYIPDMVLLGLAAIFTGSLIGLAAKLGLTNYWQLSWVSRPRWSLAAILLALVLIVVILGSVFILSGRFVAGAIFSSGMSKAYTGDLVQGEKLIKRAIGISEADIFYRSLIDFKLAALEKLLAKTDLTPEVARGEFETIMKEAVLAGQRATELSPSNYANWLALGRIYETLVPLGVEGSYQGAAQAYQKAAELNPSSPAIFLDRARLEVAAKNTTQARNYINQALDLKKTYTEAIFILAQLDSQTGNVAAAIKRSEEAAALSTGDPTIFFQLGFLRYQNSEWTRAAEALKRAVELNSNYANARYFLGLSYDALGESALALEQFKIIAASNPDNKEISQIVTNLTAGRRALVNTEPPAPKDRKKLPVKEE